MKLPWLASSLILLLLIPHVPRAQCGGTCPSGALTTLPSGTSAPLPAAPPYCIAASVVNKTTSYVIDGTLIVQGGHDSLGAVTLARTGAIDVEAGACPGCSPQTAACRPTPTRHRPNLSR